MRKVRCGGNVGGIVKKGADQNCRRRKSPLGVGQVGATGVLMASKGFFAAATFDLTGRQSASW
jgi:hypothetical protein